MVAAETVVTFAASCTDHHRDQRCRRVHLHRCGLLFLTALRTVTITSVIFSEASRLSFVRSPLWRLTKVQTTTRPDHVSPEVWAKICKATQNREKHEWKIEKPTLDNARRLGGIYFLDPDDQDYKEILKHARRK